MVGKAHMVWHGGEMPALDTDSISDKEAFTCTTHFNFQVVKYANLHPAQHSKRAAMKKQAAFFYHHLSLVGLWFSKHIYRLNLL